MTRFGAALSVIFLVASYPVRGGAQQAAPQTSVIVISAGNQDADGAAVRIDGEPAGNVPARQSVAPGRHLVQVGKRGFETFSQWVDVEAGQVLTLPVMLSSQGANTGSLLVNADVTGIPVFVDGQQRGGTPLVVDGLSVGDHLVEIRPPGEGYQPFSKVVTITAGARTTVEAKLQTAPELGSLRVITNVPGAIVSLDGIDIGNAPAAKGGLRPGEHVVMGRAEGYEPVQQTVTVIAGRERVVSLRFTTQATGDRRISVSANVPGAQVTVDGMDRGTAPVVIQPAPLGTHTIVVRAPGHREVRRTCVVDTDRDCVFQADLFSFGVPVRVEANVDGATVYVDEEERGRLPWEGDLPPGLHQIEVRALGYRTHTEELRLQDSTDVRLIQVILYRQDSNRVAERRRFEEEQSEAFRNAVSHAGAALPVDLTVLDLSIGWPYLAEFRLSTGILDFLDAGVTVRTFGRLTDFEARAKAGWKPIKQLSVGGQLRVGGGIGPTSKDTAGRDHKANDFLFSLEAIASLHFPRAGAFSSWIALDVHSDRWDYADTDSDLVVATGRQKLARARFGGSLDIILSRRWNLFVLVEGIVGGKRRRVFGDIFGGGRDDTRVYGRFGATYKFGAGEEGR